MIDGRTFSNIALVGFMGTGKSTVGQLVAASLHFRFADTDAMIEGMAGKKISEIFAQEGEARFRELEREVVKRLATLEKTVIATGGGLIVDPANFESLRRHALIVCLWATAETIVKRVGHQTHRPLLRVEDPLERVRALLQERAPFYRRADVLLSSDFRRPKEVASHVSHEFRAVARPPEPPKAAAA
jgi:shikimate kinase